MKSTEIRIGNLFIEKYSNDIMKVIELTETNIIFDGVQLGKWQAQSIPLTEDWLLKLGFEHDRNEYWMIEHEYIHFLIFVNSINKMIYHFTDVERRQYHTTKEIKHVHQLQNLYFALTDEELTINP